MASPFRRLVSFRVGSGKELAYSVDGWGRYRDLGTDTTFTSHATRYGVVLVTIAALYVLLAVGVAVCAVRASRPVPRLLGGFAVAVTAALLGVAAAAALQVDSVVDSTRAALDTRGSAGTVGVTIGPCAWLGLAALALGLVAVRRPVAATPHVHLTFIFLFFQDRNRRGGVTRIATEWTDRAAVPQLHRAARRRCHMQIKSTTIGAGLITAVLAAGLATAPAALASPTIAGTYNATPITRVVGTRTNTVPKTQIAAGQTLTVKATTSLPAGPIAAVALNVTVGTATQPGYLVVYPGGSARPATSNIDFAPGSSTPNSVVVAPGTGGTVSFFNASHGTVTVFADRYGYWTGGTVGTATGGAFRPVTPTRVADSRLAKTTLGALASGSVAIAGHAGVPTTNVSAVVATVTAVDPTRAGYFRVAASSTDSVTTSTINFVAGETRANLDTIPLNTDGTIAIINSSAGTADYVVDVLGYFTDGAPQADGAFTATTPYRTADTRTDGSTLNRTSTLTVPVFPNDGSGALVQGRRRQPDRHVAHGGGLPGAVATASAACRRRRRRTSSPVRRGPTP